MSLVTPTMSALDRRAAAAIMGGLATSMGRNVGLEATCRSAVHAAGFGVPRGTQTGGVPSARGHTLFWLTGRISAFVQASTWEDCKRTSLSASTRGNLYSAFC